MAGFFPLDYFWSFSERSLVRQSEGLSSQDEELGHQPVRAGGRS